VLPATTAAPSPTTKPTAPPTPAGFSGDGTYQVGQSMPPGVYVSTANAACDWQRSTDTSGSPESLIESDTTNGQALVQLSQGETFTTHNCNRWTLYRAPSTSFTTFGDGTWAVPGQVTPGRWRSSGGDTCSWQRRRDLRGGPNSIAAQGAASGPTIVDVEATDVAIVSNRCGTWTKVG
jgi:hypothetical protein